MAVTLRTFHNIADLGTFVLSFGANLLLLWLVTFKTSKEFRAYSRVLTLSAIMDALFALLGPIASPRLIISHDSLFIISDGFYHLFDYPVGAYVVALTGPLALCVLHSAAIQFLYRYFLLCRSRQLSGRDIGILYVIVTLLTGLSYAVFVWAASPIMIKSADNMWKLKEDPLWAEDTPVFIAYSQDDPRTKILIATIAAMFLLDVVCISFASYRIQSFLNEARRTMSRHTAKAHGQMTKVLYGQVRTQVPSVLVIRLLLV
ncbi:7TM GPCR protein [Aphelenchoides avenae]|nr:7TM GPCR protein [Aphelenchus avenae]